MLVICCALACSALTVRAQQKLEINKLKICSYDGTNTKDDIYIFSPDDGAKKFVERIMKFTGLPQNFEIRAANVANASAVIEGDKRIILYSQSYIDEVMKKTNTQWSAVSIMAHEIGHHLSGHTLSELGGNRADKELEADRFSGHVLFQMGATLDQAKAAMESLPDKTPPPSYPPKSARLAAIYSGWTAAKDESPNKNGLTEDAKGNESNPDSANSSSNTKPEKKKPAKNTSNEDDEQPAETPKKQPKILYGNHCYDLGNNPRCPLIVPLPIGTSCFCPYQGYGIVGF
jgi:hypothetical protein